MKASLKFREDQKPLFRAKVPLNIIGFPFQSGIVAGESKELALSLSTCWDSGPSFKFAYRPNDSQNPFSFVFKTGIGHVGSPISSPMNMSAEFSLIGGQNPTFFVNFKPQFGDFTIKKSQSSGLRKQLKANGSVSNEDGSVIVETPVGSLIVETPVINNVHSMESVVNSVFSDMEVSARTAVPLRKHATLNLRWGVKFPADEAMAVKRNNPTAQLPLLVMNKIGIEHVAREDSKDSNKLGPGSGSADVAGACLDVKRQLDVIQAENGMLRQAMDDLKSEFFPVKSDKVGKCREGEKGERKSSAGKTDRFGYSDKKSSEINGFGGNAIEGEVNEELNKALKGTTGG